MSPGVLSLLRGSLSVYYVWLNKKTEMILEVIRLENPGIDPGTSRMLSGRSTICANPPLDVFHLVTF